MDVVFVESIPQLSIIEHDCCSTVVVDRANIDGASVPVYAERTKMFRLLGYFMDRGGVGPCVPLPAELFLFGFFDRVFYSREVCSWT